MKNSADVVIIGGGVIGCAIAYYLSKRGVDVALLERGEIGEEASGAAAGLLAPLGPLSGPGPFADLLLAGFSMFPELVPELEATSGLRTGYERTGAIRLVRSPKRIPRLQKRFNAWRPLELEMHWLSGEEARRLEPLLSPDVCAAVYAPEEAQIEAARLTAAFAQSASAHGARIYTQLAVTGLETHGERATAVKTAADERIACRELVIASGAWTAICAAWLGVDLPISPLHGQLLSLPQPSPPLNHIIFGDAAYLAPRGPCIIVGATREETGFAIQVTTAGSSWLYETASRLAPRLKGSVIERGWAGLRPRTPDGRPILGRLPGWPNVVVAAGHNSVGVILSAITGQTISELLVAGRTSELIQPFAPERFTDQERQCPPGIT